MAVEPARLGDLLRRVRRPIAVDPDALYTQIGLRSYGKGFFAKEAVSGSALGRKRIFTIEEGDLVFNIVFAWEGAVGLAGPAEHQLCGSHRFPTYREAERSGVDIRWLLELFRTPAGVDLLGAASPGSAGRNRTLNQEQLLNFVITSPGPAEQQEAIRLLELADLAKVAAETYLAEARQARLALAQDLLRRTPVEREGSLDELATISIGRTPSRADHRFWTDDLERPFCTIADMQSRLVRPKREGVTALAEEAKKAKRVPAGSLLMSFKLTIGKVGFAAMDLFPNEAIAWIEPRDPPSLDTRYLAAWLNLYDYTSLTGEAVKGKTLNTSSLKSIRVTLPSPEDQARIVELLERSDDLVDEAQRMAISAANALADLRRALYIRSIGSQIRAEPTPVAV